MKCLWIFFHRFAKWSEPHSGYQIKRCIDCNRMVLRNIA